MSSAAQDLAEAAAAREERERRLSAGMTAQDVILAMRAGIATARSLGEESPRVIMEGAGPAHDWHLGYSDGHRVIILSAEA